MNVFNLTPGIKKCSNIKVRTLKTKYLLTTLDKELGKPDIVLIEYQMKQNDISRCMSHQIDYHYSDLVNYNFSNNLMDCGSNLITFAVSKYPLKPLNGISKKTIVEIVGPSIKNSYSFHEDGLYGNFISKYTNYTANKKHTDWNFKYFLKTFNYEQLKIKNKTNDIADAFMMIYGWLKKNNEL